MATSIEHLLAKASLSFCLAIVHHQSLYQPERIHNAHFKCIIEFNFIECTQLATATNIELEMLKRFCLTGLASPRILNILLACGFINPEQ